MKGDEVRAILFDLDGTLVDSLPGIEASLQWAIAQRLPGRSMGNIRDFIGPPLPTMLARFWPDLPAEELETVVETFRAHYDTEGCRMAQPFPGVDATLRQFDSAGISMFVLTNKRAAPTLTMLEHTGLKGHFRAIVSPDSHSPHFASKAEGALALQARYSLNPGRTIFLGDGLDDAKAAALCGFRFIAAEYGYGRVVARMEGAPFATVKTFSDLERIVL